MSRPINIAVSVFALLTFLSGCSSAKYARGYKVGQSEFATFQEMDDENALRMVAIIYNAEAETYEEDIARRVALQAHLALLKKRNSRYIGDSGIFDIKFREVDLRGWATADLISVFEALEKKSSRFFRRPVSELAEAENAKRIYHLTAMRAIAGELQARANTKNAWNFVSQALMVALSIAVSAI